MNSELATLGGGCFWCLDGAFRQMKGVQEVTSGYAGGPSASPTYKEICTGQTGHAEVVHIKFDRDQISFADLLHAFFTLHDPTTLNRQGADVGTQYRSVIFYHSEQQQATAQEVMDALADQAIWNNPIVTELSPYTAFYPAEDYHQNYYYENPEEAYCQLVIKPKLNKFISANTSLIKPDTDTPKKSPNFISALLGKISS